MERLSNQRARRLFLAAQGMAANPGRSFGQKGLEKTINQLGYVQVDSISAVARAHQHILWTRAESYNPQMLKRALEKDRSLFEHWTHDATVIPIHQFPIWHHKFELRRETLLTRPGFMKRLGPEPQKMIDEVRDHLRDNGPTMARDLEDHRPKAAKRGGWWNWKPAKSALEFLWFTGEAMVTARDGFQKVYDLTDRVVPDLHRTQQPPTREEMIDWCCREALRRLVFAKPAELREFFWIAKLDEVKAWIDDHQNELVEVEVEGADGSKAIYWALPEFLKGRAAGAPDQIRIINPFDPIMRNRTRTRFLFGFDFTLEVFVPEPKRQYGYYVCPIMQGGQFIGRADLRARRTEKPPVLEVINLYWEEGIKPDKALKTLVSDQLFALSRFAECEDIRISA